MANEIEANESMFTPVRTVVSCDPKGEWFRVKFTSAMGRTQSSSDQYMFRENIQTLRDQLNSLLEGTADGKTLQMADSLDADEARKANMDARTRLEASNAKEKARRATKRVTKADPDGNRDVIDLATGALVQTR